MLGDQTPQGYCLSPIVVCLTFSYPGGGDRSNLMLSFLGADGGTR